jgi:hypothetical protein
VKEYEGAQVTKVLRGRTNSRVRGQLGVILNFVSLEPRGSSSLF